MTTQYTPILKLALPVTGELSGTWGDVVNDNITSMVEQAIAGLATISTWTGNSKTLTTANGTTSESRCAMLVAQNGAGLSAAGEIICPASSKLYVLKNDTSYAITLKTAAGTGVAVASGNTAFLFCDGTNVNACVTTIVDGRVTGNLTVDGNATINGNTTLGNATSDTITATARFASDLVPSTDNARDLGSTANSWKDLYIDGTAYLALVDINGGTIDGVSIGASTAATIINVDNLRLDGNTISSTDTNGNVVIAPNGTGDVQLDADTVRVGDSGAAATLTSNGAGALTVTTGGAADLTLSTNSGTTSGTIVIANGANGNITLTPDGTGDVILSADRVQIGDANTDTTLTTNGTGSLNLTTNNGTNSGTIQIAQGANGNITLTPNGTGSVSVPKLVWSNGTSGRVPYLTTGGQFTDDADMTFDGTTLTVNSLSVTTGVVFSGGTANGVVYLNGSKQATAGSALTFDGTTFTHTGASNFATSTGSVGVGTASPNGKLQVAGSFASQNNIVSITSSGVASAATGAVRALYVNAQTANTASSVYGVFSEVTYTNSQTNYGGYFSAGDPSASSYGVYGLAAQTDVNGPGTAYGGYFKATAGATGNNGITYGARIENAGAVGNSAYGLTVSTVAGATTVVPFQVIHAGSDIMRINSAGRLGVGVTSPIAFIETNTTTPGTGFIGVRVNNYSGGVTRSLYAGCVDDTDVYFGSSFYQNSGNYQTDRTSGSFVNFAGGAFSVATNSGLTANTPYSPTTRFTIAATGRAIFNNGEYTVINGSVYGKTPNGTGFSLGYNPSGGSGESQLVWGTGGSTYPFIISSYDGSSTTERARFNTSGVLSVGTTNAYGRLTLNGSLQNSFQSSTNSVQNNDGAMVKYYVSNPRDASGGSSNRVIGFYGYSADEGGSPAQTMYFARMNNYYGQQNINYDSHIYYHTTTQYHYRAYSAVGGYDTWWVKPATSIDTVSGTRADMYLSGLMGVGTTNPGAYSGRLVLNNSSTYPNTYAVYNTSTSQSNLQIAYEGGTSFTNGYKAGINFASDTIPNGSYAAQNKWFVGIYATADGVGNANLAFYDQKNGSERMTLNMSGCLGIGFNSPDQPLAFADSLGVKIQYNGNNANGYQVGLASSLDSGDAMMKFTAGETGSGEFGFYNTTNLRMFINSGGSVIIGVSNGGGVANAGFKTRINYDSGNGLRLDTTATSAPLAVQFVYNNNTEVGKISTTTSSTSYNTSSDYRLKENIRPMTGALAKVSALKPCVYNWKIDGSEGQGFVAHELAEVVPQCVTGEKDEVNEDGSIKPQGIDTSFLVATLTAAIQELKAEFDAYKATHP